MEQRGGHHDGGSTSEERVVGYGDQIWCAWWVILKTLGSLGVTGKPLEPSEHSDVT